MTNLLEQSVIVDFKTWQMDSEHVVRTNKREAAFGLWSKAHVEAGLSLNLKLRGDPKSAPDFRLVISINQHDITTIMFNDSAKLVDVDFVLPASERKGDGSWCVMFSLSFSSFENEKINPSLFIESMSPNNDESIDRIIFGYELPLKEFIFEHADNNDLYVVFTSFGNEGKVVDGFEFTRLLEGNKASKLFLRDNCRYWYHSGVIGFSNNMFETFEHIKKIIEKTKGSVTFLGVSMGGYAAMLFGSLLNIDKVIAFSPQVRVDTNSLKELKDNRWKKNIEQLNRKYDPIKLDKHLKNTQFNTNIEIYVGTSDPIDMAHVKLLEGVNGLNINYIETDSHNVAGELAKRGQLKGIIIPN